MEYFIHILIISGIYIILTLSLNLIVGYTGLPALGHIAFACGVALRVLDPPVDDACRRACLVRHDAHPILPKLLPRNGGKKRTTSARECNIGAARLRALATSHRIRSMLKPRCGTTARGLSAYEWNKS